MSIKDKIDNAKPTTWLSDGIPKWQVWLIIRTAKIKAKFCRMVINLKRRWRK